jgi:protein-arginine kinase activator protein McsA
VTCDKCKKDKTGMFWSISPKGTFVVCQDCAQELSRKENKQPPREQPSSLLSNNR